MNEIKYEDIIEEFNFKIKKSLNATELQNRDDLEQEIKIKIFEKLDTLNKIDAPGFFEYVLYNKS